MSALQPEIHAARVLDLFSGSGALGLETLSRGAERVTFVEKGAPALRALKSNIDKLGAAGSVEVVRADGLAYARALGANAFDIALADPPYGHGFAAALIEMFARTPYAGSLWVEHRISDEVPDLPGSRARRYGDTVITSIPAPA